MATLPHSLMYTTAELCESCHGITTHEVVWMKERGYRLHMTRCVLCGTTDNQRVPDEGYDALGNLLDLFGEWMQTRHAQVGHEK